MTETATLSEAYWRHQRDALLDRVLYLGRIVQAVCDELDIPHDTTAAEVVAAIQALRGPA